MTDEEVRIGCFAQRLLEQDFLRLLTRFVIEKPDSETCIGFEGKLQNLESWGDLRPVECRPFLLGSNVQKILTHSYRLKMT